MQHTLMDTVINTVYLFHRDGTPLLQVTLNQDEVPKPEAIKGMYERLFSAIEEIFTQLGQEEIQSVNVNDGLLIYKIYDPFVIAAYSNRRKSEQFARFLVDQVEYEFKRVYCDIPKIGSASIYEGHFNPFRSKVIEIYETLVGLHEEYPKLLNFLPSFIPLFRLNEVLHLGLDIVKGYPHDTIKLVRQLELLFTDSKELEEVTARAIGRYSGYLIARTHFAQSMVLTQTDVLGLLNEISVSKMESSNEIFDIVICPECRDKTSEKPMCHFFSGFIEGALDNPGISVEEISCKASGGEMCRFKLHIS